MTIASRRDYHNEHKDSDDSISNVSNKYATHLLIAITIETMII